MAAEIAAIGNLCYSAFAMVTERPLSLGEYIRRLRKEAGMNLIAVSEQTRISYTHLSRIESDSSIPAEGSLVKLAAALGGDLNTMLKMANRLPQQMLNNISSREAAGSPPLRRSFASQENLRIPGPDWADLEKVALVEGLDQEEAAEIADAARLLMKMKSHQRTHLVALIRGLYHEGDEPSG